MELYQLEHFVAVVEERSFTRAAERMLRTQGAVSVAIRKLEEELGVQLMVRDSHECALTEGGHALLAYARPIIQLRDKMRRAMSDYRTLAAGRVGIASHESAAEYLLPAPLAAFSTKFPAIRLEAHLCDGGEIAHLVMEREVDLGFGIRQTSLHGLRSEIVCTDPLVLVAAADHRLSGRPAVDAAELGEERFYMHSRHTPMTVTVRRWFTEHQVPFNVAAELWNFETIKQFVRMGNGLAIVPASVVQSEMQAGQLVMIPVDQLEVSRSIEVIFRDNEALSPAPAALLDLLRTWDWRHQHPKATVSAGSSPDDAPGPKAALAAARVLRRLSR
jgi:DNA-binding transcriptional LysR family regulator